LPHLYALAEILGIGMPSVVGQEKKQAGDLMVAAHGVD
jgi:hypothetical protein